MVQFKPLESTEEIEHVEFKPLNYTPVRETNLYDFSKVDGTYYRSENGLNVQPTNKIDFVLSALNMIPNKPKPVQDILDNASYINKTLENTDFSKLASEGAKSFGRQTVNLLSGATGSMMRIYGDLGYADEEKYKDIFNQPFVKANNAVFGAIRDFGKAIEDAGDRLNQSDFLKADEELFKGDIYDNPNLHKFVDLAMSGSASLVGTYGIARISNPVVALWAMSGADAKDIYFGAREAGESKLKSAVLFAAGTAGTAKLEQIGLEKVFNIKFNKTNIEPIIKGTKDTVKKIAQAIVAEGGEEGVQTVYQNAVKKYGYDDTQDLYEGAVESMIGGALGGGLVASVNFGIERFRGTADRLGISEEEQNQFLETTAQAIADNPDLMDIPFQENMKKTYNSFTQMINELGDSPEAERLKQTKLELDEGYNKYYEQFKTFMPEVQAKANADLVRSSALFFSDLEGMSVKDWFEKKAPQVIKTKDIMQQVMDFQSRVNPVKYRVDEKDINLFEALKYPNIIKKYERKGKNLIQFIRKLGGIKDVGGELKNMDIGKQFRGVINNKSGMGLDDMTLAAWENGYLPNSDFNYGRPEIQTLLDAIRDESFGTHHYGEDTERTVYDDVEDLEEQLNRMGIDWQNMTPKEIEQAYNDYGREYEEDEREAERWAIMNEGSVSENPIELDDIPFQDIAEENARLDDIYPEYKGETITINGQEKTVYNSEGQRIAKSKESLENFYRWFGDSKVVDEQGRPLVVYHGTRQRGITEFKSPYADKLIFFAYKKEFADDWAKNAPLTEEQTQIYRDMPYFSIEVSKKYREKYGENWAENESLMQEARAERENLKKEYLRNAGIEEITMPVYLKAENTFKPAEHWDLVIDEIEKYYDTDYRDENADAQTKEYLKQIQDGKWIFFEHENVIKKIRELGFDSIELEEISGQGITTIAVFEGNNQIKSTSNRGTYSESEDIYYQEGEDRDLVALHSISASNLEKAIDFGGFPVPSIAIVKKGQEFHFDDLPITLVGNKEMIDPYDERNEVYNRDVWTKTFPWVTYKKPTQAKEKSFKNKIGEYYKRTNSENELGSFIYVAQRGDTSSALSQFQSSSGAMLYYLENIKKQKVEFAEKDLASDILERAGIDETLANEIQGLDVDTDRDKITKAFKRFLERKEEEDFSDIKDAEKREKMIKFSRKLANENYFDKEGNLYFSKADTIVTASDRYFSSKGKKFIDQYEVRRQLRDMITNDENYQEWATEFFEKELVGDKMVRVGNALKPFTLENVVDAMTTGATVASQETPLPAMGKVVAAGAKRLESIKDIKEEGKKLVTLEQSKENMEKVKETLYDFLSMFEKGDDFSRNMDRKDAVATALQGVLKNKNITKESLKKAILRQLPSDKTVSDEVLSYGVELANEIKGLARYYFEAKPQRAVGLNEFSAAIIPTGTEFDAIAKKVEDAGLKVVRNDNQTEALQEIDTDDNVFFQSEQAPRGAYVNRIIYLNENANASTLAHELAHFWSDELRNSKSLRAKEILRTADKWENQEFERKYNVVEQDGKYIVTDKSGKTVYDKQGEGFDSEVRARAYAKEELFARGFEKYLKEGKAPNKTLRAAFRNFYNWLKKIYSDMMSLDIKLSKPMRNLYADILGGTSIDTFLDSDIDGFFQQRAEAEQDRLTEVNKIISQAQGTSITLPERIRKAYEDFDFGETWKKIAVPLSTRAKRISPTLRNKLRRYEYDSLMVKQNYYKEIEPMLKKWREFSKEDSIAFDLALKNEVAEIRDEILKKYDAEEDFNKVREVLEDIYYKANDAGLEVGYIEDYFPRKVKDKDGLLSYLHGTDEWSGYQQALQREDPYNEFTAEEQADFLDKFLRGIVRADVASYKYSSEKARKLDTIDNTLNQYYADSMQALISYIDGMNARIQTVNFFGRNRENVEESIGEFIAYQLNNNLIKPNQVDEVKSILTAVFSRMGVNSQWIKGLRDVGYLYTMGGVNTAITQIDDIFVAAYKGGIFNTIQAVLSKDKITKKDLGLDSIAAEFIEGTGASKAVNWVFKKNGIELIDGFGKNALLNGVLIKMQKMSDADLRAYLEPIMEDETEQTLQDVRNGELSDNVRFFLFNELSDMQPVSLSELPELYNTGGNMRIFYMLKSFMLKRIDTIRNECYDKIKTGNKSEQQEGLRNLYRLVLLMMIGGASKDLLIDLMYQRVIDLNDMLVNNLLGIIGISKYNIYQVREEGLGHSLAIFAMPPLFQVAEDLSGDVNKYLDGKRELKDFEVFKGLPIVGRFYYWLIGGGKTKTEKKRGKSKY